MNTFLPTPHPIPSEARVEIPPTRKQTREIKAARMPVRCTKCKELKPSTAFSFQSVKRSSGYFALKSWCRACCSLAAKEHRAKRLEKLKELNQTKWSEEK